MRGTLMVLVGRGRRSVDAIREHGERLAEAVREAGGRAVVIEADRGARWVAKAADCDAVLVQYNPFQYGKWGFAPWLPAGLARLRRTPTRPLITLMVHESFVPIAGWRSALMGLWQRSQLVALRGVSDVVLASIEPWAELMRRQRPRRPTFHVPVGSNLPDRRNARREARAGLGASDDTLVLASLTTGHPSHLLGHVVSAANAVAERRGRALLLLHLGAGAPPLDGVEEGVRVYAPGRLPVGSLAETLASADLYLAPFVDGVSTRRSSMMAALQHALPIIGTDGPLTDAQLREASDALRLVPVDVPGLFTDAVVELAESAEKRQQLGERGRRLYERCFDWSVIVRRLNEILGAESWQ